MDDSAQRRVGTNSSMKDGAARSCVLNFSRQLAHETRNVWLLLRPSPADGFDLDHNADRPQVAMAHRDEVSDGPSLAGGVEQAIDYGLSCAQGDKPSDDASCGRRAALRCRQTACRRPRFSVACV